MRSLVVNLRVGWIRNKSTLRSAIALGGGNITAFILGAIGSLLAARFLGPEETGLYRSFTIPLTYLTFLHLGTFDGLFRQIPFFVGKGNQVEVERLASAAGAWNLWLSFAISSAFLICALYSLWHHQLPAAAAWFSQSIFCWGVFYGGYLNATYRTIHQFAMVARIQVVQMLINFAMVFTLPLLHFYGLCLRFALPAVAGISIYHHNRPLRIAYRFDIKALKDVIKVGLPFSFWGSLDTSLWFATESTLILYWGGTSALGLFSIAFALREGLNVLPFAAQQVLFPRLVESFSREGNLSRKNMRSVFLVVGAMIFFLTFIVLIGTVLLERLVPLFIPRYVAGIPLMKICLWFAVVAAANTPAYTLYAEGRAWLYGSGVLIGLLVFALSSYFMAPSGGIIAVVVGSLLGRIARVATAYTEMAILRKPSVL
jgi:O-antigen/teichoic acid export membrane protein